MGWSRLSRLAALVGSCVAVACTDGAAEREQGAHRVSATSTADATAAVADEELRFRLAWPGPGWKLLSRGEAQALVPGAVAGAISHRGISAVLLLEAAAKRTSGDCVARLLAQLALSDVLVEHNEATEVGGKAARRFVVRGTADGVDLRYAGLALVHEGHYYQLVGWGRQSSTTADGSWLKPLEDALSLQDGKVTVAARPTPAPESLGQGWRIVDGVFESALAGARLKPPPGWALLAGPRLQRTDPEALAGLERSDPPIRLYLRQERIPPARRVGLLQRLSQQAREDLKLPDPPERETVTLAGQQLELLRYATGDEEVHHGVLLGGEHGLHVVARHRRADAARVHALLPEAWSAIELLSPDAASKLTDELAETAALQHRVGPDFCVRNGTYRDFKWRLAWTQPKGFWRIAAGELARQVNRDAVLYVHEPRLGLHGLLIVEPASGMEAAAYHAKVTDRLSALVGFVAKPAEEISVDEVDALASEGEAGASDRRLRYRVVTTVHEDRAIQVLVWGWPPHVLGQPERVAAVAAGLTIQAVPSPVEHRAGTYRDVRMGFELQPPSGWDPEDLTPEELAARGTFVRWARDGRWLAVVGIGVVDGGDDGPWLAGWLEQQLRDEIGPLGRSAVQSATKTIAGKTARHSFWSSTLHRIDVAVLRRDDVLFGLVAVDSSSETFELLAQRFVLLP